MVNQHAALLIEIYAPFHEEALRGVVLHNFLELSSYTIMGAGGRSGDVGSIDEPGLECVLVCVGVSVCRFGFSTLATSKRSEFSIVTALGNAYVRK